MLKNLTLLFSFSKEVNQNLCFFTDKCLIPGTLHYRRNGGCNCFYKCRDGISEPSCCPKGFRYDDDKGCVPAFGSLACDDECETPTTLTTQVTVSCKLTTLHITSPSKYQAI